MAYYHDNCVNSLMCANGNEKIHHVHFIHVSCLVTSNKCTYTCTCNVHDACMCTCTCSNKSRAENAQCMENRLLQVGVHVQIAAL